MKTPGSFRPLAGSALAAVTWCFVLGGLAGGDPMFLVEAIAGSGFMLWAFLVVRELVAAWRVERTLAVDAIPVVIGGVACRLTPALGTDAIVVGAMRPRIYVGWDLIQTFSDDELEAVLYHEDHHRETLTPLRGAALTAWLRILGRAGPVRDVVLDRLADLETMADAEALRRGSTAATLARALLKGGDPHGLPAGFSYAADRRVEHLLSHVEGDDPVGSRRLPYEWLPIAMFAVAAVGCHLALLGAWRLA